MINRVNNFPVDNGRESSDPSTTTAQKNALLVKAGEDIEGDLTPPLFLLPSFRGTVLRGDTFIATRILGISYFEDYKT